MAKRILVVGRIHPKFKTREMTVAIGTAEDYLERIRERAEERNKSYVTDSVHGLAAVDGMVAKFVVDEDHERKVALESKEDGS